MIEKEIAQKKRSVCVCFGGGTEAIWPPDMPARAVRNQWALFPPRRLQMGATRDYLCVKNSENLNSGEVGV